MAVRFYLVGRRPFALSRRFRGAKPAHGDDYFIADVSYDKVSLQVTATRKLFTMPSVSAGASFAYDVAPDGRMVLIASEIKAGFNRLAWNSDWRKQLPK